MFTKPIDEITFEDVESFCEQWAEGVRVEYKSEIEEVKGKIPKIVSSFANTYGGILLIGVEADQKNNRVNSIPGIQRKGIEEQIRQSALTGIYPGVIPEVRLVEVPNTGNVVVIVRVDESIQAPHAIKEVTQVYIRVGSITQPYEYKLAEMDRIAYMFKRREDSQVVARQILDRIETRAKHNLDLDMPTLTVTAQPVFPYRPVISTSDIYDLPNKDPWPPRRVAGGISCFSEERFLDLNEYGIVCYGVILSSPAQEIDYDIFLWEMKYLINHARNLYEKCEYIGNIKVTARLGNVFGKKLVDRENRGDGWRITDNIDAEPKCFDSEVLASKQCLSRDLKSKEERKDIVEELVAQLLWAFNIPINNLKVRARVRKRIEQHFT